MTIADIAELPVAEKLRLMEKLWESLCAQQAGGAIVPDWHKEALAERLRCLDGGAEPVSSWAEAKVRIRAQSNAV
ncbi:MAG: addiction module protein [Pseudomonadales bacterium]|jgi:hypothetical protein|nr:addiction module protein [Pseudomonadales bacterium]